MAQRHEEARSNLLEWQRLLMAGLEELLLEAAVLGDALEPMRRAIERARETIAEVNEEKYPALAAPMLKPCAEMLADALFAASYAADIASEEEEERRNAETDALRFFCAHYLGSQPPQRNLVYAAQIARIASL